MTPLVTTVDTLPVDRPISYRDEEKNVIVVRIYDECPLTDKRRREIIASLRVQGFTRQKRARGCGYDTYHLRIRTRHDGRRWKPVRLADRFGIRYITPNPHDPIVEKVQAGIIKHGIARYEVFSREWWLCKD